MAKKFENITVGDQLELPASAHPGYQVFHTSLDPDRIVRAVVVTHIWFDPVENTQFVALADFKRDGSYGRPIEKRTITGLARYGWRRARQDWIAYLEQINSHDTNIINIFDKRVS